MSGVTPNGIRYPDGASKAKNLGPELQQMAEDIDAFIDREIDASSPAFQDEARAAVADELEARKIVEYDDPTEAGVLAAVTDLDGTRTWLEANSVDGGPTGRALSLLRSHAPIPEHESTDDGVLAAVTDLDGTRTWLEANSVDGGPTARAISVLTAALGIDDNPPRVYVADGDSMTRGGHGPGESWPELLSGLLGGVEVRNRGISGTTMAEIALRVGMPLLLTIPGGQVPADATPATVTVDHPGPWSGSGLTVRTYAGTVRGVPVILKREDSVWTITRSAPGAAVPLASPVPFVADPVDLLRNSVHIIWGGRNNNPVTTAPADVARAVDRLPVGAHYLVVSVCNQTSEPAGSTVYEQIITTNEQLIKAHPLAYVDMRGRLIREGLALAGIAPTADDTTAIGEDRIPPSLLFDGLHLNGPGRIAAAAIIHDELTYRSLA